MKDVAKRKDFRGKDSRGKADAAKAHRIDLRVTADQKAVIEQGALLSQRTVSMFIIGVAYEAAEKVIRESADVVLSVTDWRLLCQALEGVRQSSTVRNIVKRKSRFQQ